METEEPPLRQAILNQALQLGSNTGWEALTLHQVAVALNISLADIHHYFPQKDDLVEAWFDRADQVLLSRTPSTSWSTLPARDRLERTILCWLDAMAEYRQLTREMLLYKLEPGHVHLQIGGVLRISRTVQWFREAAGLTASHGRRILQETALTALYVAVFTHWLTDNSIAQHNTRRLLRYKLSAGDLFGLWH